MASTTSNVAITLIGKKGISEAFHLSLGNKKNGNSTSNPLERVRNLAQNKKDLKHNVQKSQELVKFFQSGAIDNFVLTTNKKLGSLQAIRIWHDSSGKSPEWFLNKVIITGLNYKTDVYHCHNTKTKWSESRNDTYIFIENNWIDLELGNKMIDVVVPLASYEQMVGFESVFGQVLRKELREYHPVVSYFCMTPESYQVFDSAERCAVYWGWLR